MNITKILIIAEAIHGDDIDIAALREAVITTIHSAFEDDIVLRVVSFKEEGAPEEDNRPMSEKLADENAKEAIIKLMPFDKGRIDLVKFDDEDMYEEGEHDIAFDYITPAGNFECTALFLIKKENYIYLRAEDQFGQPHTLTLDEISSEDLVLIKNKALDKLKEVEQIP